MVQIQLLSNSKIYRTDINGSIQIVLNKNGYKIRTYIQQKWEIMNYYEDIKKELINDEIIKKVKDYSKNRNT